MCTLCKNVVAMSIAACIYLVIGMRRSITTMRNEICNTFFTLELLSDVMVASFVYTWMVCVVVVQHEMLPWEPTRRHIGMSATRINLKCRGETQRQKERDVFFFK